MQSNAITNIAEVTPSDAVDLTYPGIGLYVGISGDVKLTTPGGNTVTLTNLVAGVMHPIQTVRIFDTGTDADEIFVGW